MSFCTILEDTLGDRASLLFKVELSRVAFIKSADVILLVESWFGHGNEMVRKLFSFFWSPFDTTVEVISCNDGGDKDSNEKS